jgi:hypothetical protein
MKKKKKIVVPQVCKSCGRVFRPDPRVSQQRFCSRPECQRIRLSIWQKRKRSTDKEYQGNQADAQKKWTKRNRSYWKKYRETHPDYAKRNRELQKNRNLAKKFGAAETAGRKGGKIAKMDPSHPKNLIRSGYYKLIPLVADPVAKMYEILVKIEFISARSPE